MSLDIHPAMDCPSENRDKYRGEGNPQEQELHVGTRFLRAKPYKAPLAKGLTLQAA